MVHLVQTHVVQTALLHVVLLVLMLVALLVVVHVILLAQIPVARHVRTTHVLLTAQMTVVLLVLILVVHLVGILVKLLVRTLASIQKQVLHLGMVLLEEREIRVILLLELIHLQHRIPTTLHSNLRCTIQKGSRNTPLFFFEKSDILLILYI